MNKPEKDTTQANGFVPIDIPAPDFFWIIQRWKEGKLATIDGRGRFAEISFIGANKIQIKPLAEFPRTSLDRELMTWPEAGLLTSTSGKVQHLAAVDAGKTKSHVPLLSWVHQALFPVLLDPREGLVAYTYSLQRDKSKDVEKSLFVYNYREDKIVHTSPEGFSIWMILSMDERYRYMLSYQGSFDGQTKEEKIIFYDWRTGEIAENDLTKTLKLNRVDLILEPCRNIEPARRYLFGYSRTMEKRLKIVWDEEYSDIKITPLDYLLPTKENTFGHFLLSADGAWASTLVKGFRGLYNERLCKRAFFHMDGRYPNGMSMAIITEDYENSQWDYGAFVNHPVHGLCYAQEWHTEEKGKDRLYLRLYRMDSVLEEINRRLPEKGTRDNEVNQSTRN